MTQTQELATLLQQDARPITVGGMQFNIRPLTLSQIAALMRQLEGLQLGEPGEGWTDATSWRDFLLSGEARAIEAVSIASRWPVEVVRELNAAHLAQLVEGLLEVNTDFFGRSLIPALARVLQAVGRIPSHSSSPTGTAEPKSEATR